MSHAARKHAFANKSAAAAAAVPSSVALEIGLPRGEP
jgi:hypothetical protein